MRGSGGASGRQCVGDTDVPGGWVRAPEAMGTVGLAERGGGASHSQPREQGRTHDPPRVSPQPTSQADFVPRPLTGVGRGVKKFARSIPVLTKGG